MLAVHRWSLEVGEMDELTERALTKLSERLKDIEYTLSVRVHDLEMEMSDLRSMVREMERRAR